MPSIFGIWNDSLDHLVHLLVAYLLALPIGWHREREEHGAGLRTFPLVAIASCGLVQTAISVFGATTATFGGLIAGRSASSDVGSWRALTLMLRNVALQQVVKVRSATGVPDERRASDAGRCRDRVRGQ